jgi:RHS repeat-associated protein
VSIIENDGKKKMKNAGSDNITYDENGNMTSMTNSCGTTNYTWDARNRLVGISGYKPDCTALTASFKYDALGRRTEKTINGRTIQYLYDGLDIVQEIENSVVSANYVRTLNIDEPLARIKADGTVRYYQRDGLWSIIALTDEGGVVRTQYSYDPFGAVSFTGEQSDNTFQYTGREDDETGLYYYRARYYSPELQRFVSEDPIGLDSGDVNFYSYVGNNPVNFTDPRGLYILINPPPPRVPPRQPPPGSPLDALLRCMENCIGTTLIITSTYEDTPEHPPGTPHRGGVGADIRPGGNSGGLLCCASQCGAGFGQDEGNHIHVQIPRGRRGGRGQLP